MLPELKRKTLKRVGLFLGTPRITRGRQDLFLQEWKSVKQSEVANGDSAATKQMASAHAMLRTRSKVSAGSPPSSHANTAANKRNTEKKSPNALKKSQ